jgi:hypothetical protein
MARYQGADLSFDVPNDWDDKSIVAFSAPAKPGTIVPNITLTRDKMKPEETLDAYCDRTIVDMVKNLAAFKLIGKEARKVGESPAVEIIFAWNGTSGKQVQQQMLIVSTGGKAVVGLNLTCDSNDAKKLQPIAERIFSSFNLAPRA